MLLGPGRALRRACLLTLLCALGWLGVGGCKTDKPLTPDMSMTSNDDMSSLFTCESTKCENPDAKCCNGEPCVDVTANTQNCGQCGKVCRTRELCQNGSCSCNGGGHSGSCASAETCCSDGCHETQTDVKNCGGCGAACPGGQVCEPDRGCMKPMICVVGCHVAGGTNHELDLSTPTLAYRALTTQTHSHDHNGTSGCDIEPAEYLVNITEPDESYVLHKLGDVTIPERERLICGRLMPSGQPPLTRGTALVRSWIEAGAPPPARLRPRTGRASPSLAGPGAPARHRQPRRGLAVRRRDNGPVKTAPGPTAAVLIKDKGHLIQIGIRVRATIVNVADHDHF